MSVLLLPPIFQFFDNNGDPLANGFVYTYAAGTTTPQATFTDSTGTIAAPNPIELNAAGRPTSGSGAIWGEGAYKFIVKDANGTQVGDILDNVTSFTTLASASSAYFQSFSGNGSQTLFTTSSDLGTEEKALMVFVSKGLEEIAVNGSFATDTGWTKGAGWTIGSGVATATGAISTALSQVPTISLVAGQAYAVTYTITRSAGGLIPSLGGQAGTERTASGTYREVIIAAATTPIAFTGNSFTGTLDSVSITRADAQGYDIVNPSAYTISGTSLTFATAPATGTNNIYVFAPSLLLGAASAAAALAQTYAANALTSETNAAISASSAAGYAAARNQWTFSTTTTMADPSTANVRLNNATLSSVTQIAISDLSANAGNPDLGAWLDTWDNAGGTNAGSIFIFKDNGNFAIYNVNSTVTDNTSWHQVPVTYVAHAGSFSASDALLFGFSASGTTTVVGGLPTTGGTMTGAIQSNSNISTTANIGVGTNSPTQAVHVVGDNKKIYLDGTTNDYSITNDGTNVKIRHETLGGNIVTISGAGAAVGFAIGNTAAATSAIFDVAAAGTTQGSRPVTSLTTAQKNAVSAPATGLQCFDTNLTRPAWYNGSAWEYSPFGKRFTSTGQTITAAGALTIAHGLGVTPFLVQAWAVCGTAEANYSIGDRMPMPIGIASTAGSNQGLTLVADATNLTVRYGSGGLILLNKTTGAAAALTAANWTIVFEAFA